MRAETRGFLLFSFAFSFVLTSPENAIPSNNFNDKNIVDPASISNHPEKTINQPDGPTTQETAHDLEKRAVMFSPDHSYENRLSDGYSKILLDTDELEKRSKMGFTGMRGKKECSEEGMENCGQIRGSDDDSAALDTTKRALRGFGGWFGGKRAPLSFHGMRGKKADEFGKEMAGPGLYDYKATMPAEEFLINSGLLDDGDSKPGLDLPEVSGSKPEEEILDEELLNKRSPYSFQGMRGKKNNLYNLKRAMGFLGMRGKKESQFWYPEGFYKRVPQSSFFGMKGKKAQFNGFFGMRGKKASSPPFLDLQDKQEPLIYDMEDINVDGWTDSEPTSNRFRRGTAWWNNSKKAKNAFFGIRGKKLIEENMRNQFPASFE